MTREYLGYSKGFVATNAITDPRSDTQGYIGYMTEHSSIYVVLRGTHSFQNWINDFDARMVKFNGSADCVECYVHEGFAYAWSQVALKVISDVALLREKFPSYSIVVTGHSLGGALASLGALHLQEYFSSQAAVSNAFSLRAVQKLGVVPNIRLFTFGAPRFSNQALSAYASRLLGDKHRVTHYRDMAPHVPPYWQYIHIQGKYCAAFVRLLSLKERCFNIISTSHSLTPSLTTYPLHTPFAGEWYEDELGAVHTCEGFEDPDCADRWYYTSVDDHMHYLGLAIGEQCVSWTLFLEHLFRPCQFHPLRQCTLILILFVFVVPSPSQAASRSLRASCSPLYSRSQSRRRRTPPRRRISCPERRSSTSPAASPATGYPKAGAVQGGQVHGVLGGVWCGKRNVYGGS